MLSAAEMGVNNVPAFLTKIWSLVEDPSTDELIAWDSSGLSFHVFDQAKFAKEILPMYFKHNNIASFIRQLNMYGFRKVVHLESGAIKTEYDDVEFHHPSFIRGKEHLLEHIKRKSSTGGAVVGMKTEPSLKLNEEDVNRVLSDVQLMKGKQDNLSGKMDKMKKENEALWREVASLRQKHLKQQQIVNKLIQFMVHLVGGNPGMPGSTLPKRKMPLMINDASQVSAAKRPKYSKQLSIEELDNPQNYVVKSPVNVSADMMGPVIQEVIDTPPSITGISSSKSATSLDTHNYSKPVSTTQSTPDFSTLSAVSLPGYSRTVASPVSVAPTLTLEKVSPSKHSDIFGDSLSSTDLSNLLQVEDTANLPPLEDSSSNSNVLDKLELSGHLDNLQEDINGLKDILGTQYNFDPSTLFSLFSSENNLPVSVENLLGDLDKDNTMTMSSFPTDTNPNTIAGNELVQFHPAENFLANFTDLNDIIDNDVDHSNTVAATPVINITPLVDEEPEEVDPMSFINTDTNNVPDYETLNTPVLATPPKLK